MHFACETDLNSEPLTQGMWYAAKYGYYDIRGH